MDLSNKRIMITNCCGLGDLIMFTPTLRRLKEKFPSCHITFLCRDNNRAVLEGLPYVDKVACIYRGRLLGRYTAIPELFRQDVIIFMEWQPVTLFFAKLLRIPVRIGFGGSHALTRYLTKEISEDIFQSTDYRAILNAQVIFDALETTHWKYRSTAT